MTVQMMETSQGRHAYATPEQHAMLISEEKERSERMQRSLLKARDNANAVTADMPLWEAKHTVDLAKANLAKARLLPSPIATQTYGRWDGWAERMRVGIESIHTPLEALHFAQSQAPFDDRDTNPDQARLIERYRCITHSDFIEFTAEIDRQCDEKMSVPSSLSLVDGEQPVSNMYYWHMRSMLACLRSVKHPKRVAEIGGGYGSMARLWLSNEIAPIEQYILFDIPESLFFAEACLRTQFPGEVGYFDGTNDVSQHKIVMVPIGHMYKFKGSFDLVINSGSMQEMAPEWVREWGCWIDKSPAKFFYSLNYMGGPAYLAYESRNYWAPCLSAQWRSISIESDPPLITWLSPSRYFCELIFERSPPTVSLKKNWSVYNGATFNRRTYIEGLELVRQEPSVEAIIEFLTVVYDRLSARGYSSEAMPKEMVYLAHLTAERGHKWSMAFLNQVAKQPRVHAL